MRGHADPAVADAELGVGHRHQRSAAGVAEQHDRLGAAPHHLVVRGLDVDDARLVEAVGVVVHVARAEPEHRVSRGGEQRAGVVHAEVAARVRQDHRRLPRRADRRRPQHAAHERAVRRHHPHRLALHRDAGVVLRQRPVAETDRPLPAAQHHIGRHDREHSSPPTVEGPPPAPAIGRRSHVCVRISEERSSEILTQTVTVGATGVSRSGRSVSVTSKVCCSPSRTIVISVESPGSRSRIAAISPVEPSIVAPSTATTRSS